MVLKVRIKNVSDPSPNFWTSLCTLNSHLHYRFDPDVQAVEVPGAPSNTDVAPGWGPQNKRWERCLSVGGGSSPTQGQATGGARLWGLLPLPFLLSQLWCNSCSDHPRSGNGGEEKGDPIKRKRSQWREWDHKAWAMGAMLTVQNWPWYAETTLSPLYKKTKRNKSNASCSFCKYL